VTTTRSKEPAAFPVKGDRVAHGTYGPGTITDLDIYHTVIDFDGHGPRRFVTNKVVLEPTLDPGPSASERRATEAKRTREERKRKREAAKEEELVAAAAKPKKRVSTARMAHNAAANRAEAVDAPAD
jgi:hypothetical protein